MNQFHSLLLRLHLHGVFWGEIALTLFFVLLIFLPSASAADVVRFQDRSLTLQSARPGDVTTYTLQFRFTTPTTTGSVDLLFCVDPIPYLPCDSPTGLDVSGASLASQVGETGFALDVRSSNHLVLTRGSPSVVGNDLSTYVISGIKNPTFTAHSYAIRMHSYASSNATGTIIDVGAVTAQITPSVVLETQVPPMLVFCVGQLVSETCGDVLGGNFSDMGEIDGETTVTAMSQMAVGTNATDGFVITVNGRPPAAGTRVLSSPNVPTLSQQGTNQFGINLVANTTPAVGADPDGDSMNAVATNDYGQSNRFMYRDGDVVASAPEVSLVRRFTVSYIVNAPQDLPAGVYSTTLTYICSGRF